MSIYWWLMTDFIFLKRLERPKMLFEVCPPVAETTHNGLKLLANGEM